MKICSEKEGWTSEEPGRVAGGPVFSIVVPTYNRAALIGDTIESVLGQTFGRYELIIVDDGSTDDTEAVVRAWMQQNSCIKYVKKVNGERGAARNFGVRLAKGEYVTFMDSDDIAYPFALDAAFQHLQDAAQPPCFALRYEVKDKLSMKETVPPPQVNAPLANEALKSSNVLGCMGVFLRRDIARSLPFEEDREFAGSEDWLMWLKLGARYPIPYDPRICFCYFQHDERSVMSFSEARLRYRAEMIRHYLMQDLPSLTAYGADVIDAIYAHMLTYASLHLAMSRKKSRAVHYLLMGVRQNVHQLFTRRTLGILKTILLK